jgi:hypothetical protein
LGKDNGVSLKKKQNVHSKLTKTQKAPPRLSRIAAVCLKGHFKTFLLPAFPDATILHHISMDENQTSIPESTRNPGKWIGQLVAAVILAQGIWGFLASLTSNLLVPLLARVIEADPQSQLYLGKGELNVPALFNSVLALCLAGIAFVLLYEWSRSKPPHVRVKVVRVTKKVSQPDTGPVSIMAPPGSVASQTQIPVNPPPASQISQTPVSAPMPTPQQSKPASLPVVAPKPAKPKRPKEVYYNIVGEPINPTEND